MAAWRPFLVLSTLVIGGCASGGPTLATRQYDATAPAIRGCFGTSERMPTRGEQLVDVLPEPMTKVAPIYPQLARDAAVEGTVVIDALVCVDGRVYYALITRSVPMLD